MKSQLKIDHLLSKSVNGMIIQAFSYMTDSPHVSIADGEI